MKILLLAPQPFYSERGTPIAIRLLITALCRDGHQVDVLTYHEGENIDIPGMRLFRIKRPPGINNVPIGFSLKKLVCDAWLACSTFRMLHKEQYDVVHAVEESVFIAIAARLLWRYKLVYDMDSLMADQIVEKWPKLSPVLPLMRWFESFAIKRSDLVFAVCPAIAERAGLSIHPDKVHLIPDAAMAPALHNGADIVQLRDLCSIDAPLAVYAGNLEHYQGIDLLLQALAAIPIHDRCNLVIIGGTPALVDMYRQQLAGMGLTQHVHLIGQRPLSDLSAYLAQADIVCSPRLKGVNTPMKVYAYMLSGKALLATDILSHNQVLDADCAVLVKPDAESMASGLLQLIQSPELGNQLGARAAERAQDYYSEKAFDMRVKTAYLQLGNAYVWAGAIL